MRPQGGGLKKREILFAVAAGALAAGGAGLTYVAITGGPETEFIAAPGPNQVTYQLQDFDGISTSGPQDVIVTNGEAFSVRSEGDPIALAQLEAAVENGRLLIRPKEGSFWGNWGAIEDATFHVTMPRIASITMAGSGDISVDRIEGDSFEGTVGGPGEIAIGDLRVDEAIFTVAGSGTLVAAGAARETRVTIAGAGEIQAGGLRSENASVSIGGSGDVALTVDKEAQVSITGSGDVDIAGPGRCSVTRMGSGEVRCSGGGGDEDE